MFVTATAQQNCNILRRYSKFMYAMCLVCCASGMHNSITTLSKTIIVRSTHVTGTITDIFMVLGFYARTGNPVHNWKLKVRSQARGRALVDCCVMRPRRPGVDPELDWLLRRSRNWSSDIFRN